MCFQRRLFTTVQIVLRQTLNSILRAKHPLVLEYGSYLLRISNTCSSVSFAIPDFSPCALNFLPFLTQSAPLSAWVPLKRCPGLQQIGLSQVCSTFNEPGSSSLPRRYAIRWVGTCFLLALQIVNRPYPRNPFLPDLTLRDQFQHFVESAVMATWDQKRSVSSLEISASGMCMVQF